MMSLGKVFSQYHSMPRQVHRAGLHMLQLMVSEDNASMSELMDCIGYITMVATLAQSFSWELVLYYEYRKAQTRLGFPWRADCSYILPDPGSRNKIRLQQRHYHLSALLWQIGLSTKGLQIGPCLCLLLQGSGRSDSQGAPASTCHVSRVKRRPCVQVTRGTVAVSEIVLTTQCLKTWETELQGNCD